MLADDENKTFGLKSKNWVCFIESEEGEILNNTKMLNSKIAVLFYFLIHAVACRSKCSLGIFQHVNVHWVE